MDQEPVQSGKSSARKEEGRGGACASRVLGWREWLPIAVALAVVTALTHRCLPPSICLGDFGDLQMAAATLGIAHPPGYVILATLLYPFTIIPGMDPMFGVSLGCLLSGLAAMGLGMLILIRLGVNAWIAAASIAATLQYSRVRLNLIAPEVYMPTLLALVASIYFAQRYARSYRRRELIAAGICFGVALFSRPPIALCAPFFVAAWWAAERRRGESTGAARPWSSLALLIIAAAVPGVYALGYSLLRDDADTRYNYIEHYNFDEKPLPTLDEGLAARAHRAVWLISGKQFTEYVRFDLHRLRRMTYWLRNEIAPAGYGWTPFLSSVVLSASGAMLAWRRSKPVTLLLAGLIIQSFLYLCIYEMHGQAADIMPLIFSGALFVGVAAWQLLAHLGRWAGFAAVLVFSSSMVVNVGEVLPSKLCRPAWVDAEWYVVELAMDDLPRDSVILAMWDESVPIRYAQVFAAPRPDITVVTSTFHRWPTLFERFAERPVYTSRPLDWLPQEYRCEPVGPIWRVYRIQP